MLYKITEIKHLDGTNRTDGRYPLRIGRICKFIMSDPETDKCLYLEWIQNADGTPNGGWFRTSLVKQIERHDDDTLTVTTCNSIYTFKRVI